MPPEGRDPIPGILIARNEPCVTVCRTDLIDDQSWEAASRSLRARLGEETGSSLYSVLRAEASPASAQLVVLHRAVGARPFDVGDRDLLHAVHSEIGPWLWRASAQRATGATPIAARSSEIESRPVQNTLSLTQVLGRLSPAQRAVLPHLLEGKTEAEVARRIFRSRYTVHDHARAIYAACGVRNRVELVLLFTRLQTGIAGSAPILEVPVVPVAGH